MKKIFWASLAVGMMTFGTFTAAFATPVYFQIDAGAYGNETSWSINQLTGGSFSEGIPTGSMAWYTDYTYNWDLGGGEYRLTLGDTFGDGLDGRGHIALAVNGTYLINHAGNFFGSSYTLDFTVPNSVPEPATMLLFGTGIAGLAAAGRRKRN